MRRVSIYGIGFFSLSLQYMLSLVIPLWALHLHAGAVLIGTAVAANSLIPFFYAIPVGTLVDRFGARRILRVSATGSMLSFLLYPLLPSITALLALQVVNGLLQSVNWQATQTYVSRYGTDTNRDILMGRFGSATTLGTFLGPLLVGVAAKIGFGPAFLSMAAWSFLLCVGSWIIPAESHAKAEPVTLGAFKPRLDDFVHAARLMTIPGVLLVMLGTFCRLATVGIQRSFYPVLLTQDHYSPAVIGFFVAVTALSSAASAPLAPRLSRRWGQSRVLAVALSLAILGQALPAITKSYAGLFALAIEAGLAIGLTLPVLLTLMATSTSPELRGTCVALRNAMSRLASAVIPFLLGIFVHGFGIHIGMFLMGACLLVVVWLSTRTYDRRLAQQAGEAAAL